MVQCSEFLPLCFLYSSVEYRNSRRVLLTHPDIFDIAFVRSAAVAQHACVCKGIFELALTHLAPFTPDITTITAGRNCFLIDFDSHAFYMRFNTDKRENIAIPVRAIGN